MAPGADGDGEEPSQYNSIVAIGGKDAVISVWTCGADRPLVVFRDSFTNAVSDLSWSRVRVDGDSSSGSLMLLGSSHDGSVCAFVFDDVRADGFGLRRGSGWLIVLASVSGGRGGGVIARSAVHT